MSRLFSLSYHPEASLLHNRERKQFNSMISELSSPLQAYSLRADKTYTVFGTIEGSGPS